MKPLLNLSKGIQVAIVGYIEAPPYHQRRLSHRGLFMRADSDQYIFGRISCQNLMFGTVTTVNDLGTPYRAGTPTRCDPLFHKIVRLITNNMPRLQSDNIYQWPVAESEVGPIWYYSTEELQQVGGYAAAVANWGVKLVKGVRALSWGIFTEIMKPKPAY